MYFTWTHTRSIAEWHKNPHLPIFAYTAHLLCKALRPKIIGVFEVLSVTMKRVS